VRPEERFRIREIRESKWFSQFGRPYSAEGITIGQDAVHVDERLVTLMQSKGYNPTMIRNNIINNRHNSLTAHYYLLQKKTQSDPSLLKQPEASISIQIKRSDSPLVYRPAFITTPVTVVRHTR
jgi:hypothetical protein